MDPAAEANIPGIEAGVRALSHFKSDSRVSVKEVVAAQGQVTIAFKARSKYGFPVAYTASEAAVATEPTAIVAQLEALVTEALGSRYQQIRQKAKALSDIFKADE